MIFDEFDKLRETSEKRAKEHKEFIDTALRRARSRKITIEIVKDNSQGDNSTQDTKAIKP